MFTPSKFGQTIAILQGDIENLENDKTNLEMKLEQQTTKKGGILSDMKLGSKIKTLGGQGSLYGGSSYQSPPSGRRGQTGSVVVTPSTISDESEVVEQNPLLLSKVHSVGVAWVNFNILN